MRRLLPHATYQRLLIRAAAGHCLGSRFVAVLGHALTIGKGSDAQLRDDRTVPSPDVSQRNKPSPIVLRTVKCMEKAMSTSHQGIDKHKGEMQPSDKDRAQTAHKTPPDKSISHESTRDSRLDDQAKKSGSQ
jgi:hypothetical protein